MSTKNKTKTSSKNSHSGGKECKIFFLGILGFAPNKDAIISKTFEKVDREGNSHVDGRGEQETEWSCGEVTVKKSVECYHSVVSYFSREKTHHRRYLPCDVTVSKMYTFYILAHRTISSSTFYRIFKTI